MGTSQTIRKAPRPVCFGLSVLAVGLLLGGAMFAQQADVKDDLTVSEIDTRIKAVNESKDLDDAAKTKIVALYEQAKASLAAAKDWSGKLSQYEKEIKEAPGRLREVRDELEELPTKPTLEISPLAPLSELEQKLAEKEQALQEAKQRLAELEAEPAKRKSERVEIPKQISDLKAKLEEVNQKLKTLPPDDPPELMRVKKAALEASKAAYETQIEALNQLLRRNTAREELWPHLRDLAARKVSLLEQEVKLLQQTVDEKRKEEAEEQVREARRQAAKADPAVRELAVEVAELLERTKELETLRQGVDDKLARVTKTKDDLGRQFQRTQEKVEAVGLTNAIGLRLRKQRSMLPNLTTHQRNIARIQPEIRDVQLELFELEDRRAQLADIESEIKEFLKTVDPSKTELSRDALQLTVREYLQSQKQALDAARQTANDYFETLVDLDAEERQLIQLTHTYSQYIDERVLWIRSTTVLSLSDISHVRHAAQWLFSASGWTEVGQVLARDAQENPLLVVIAIIGFAILLWSQRRARKLIANIGEAGNRNLTYRFYPTVQSLLATLIVAATWPALLGFLAWRLRSQFEASEFVRAVGSGLMAASVMLLLLQLLRQICRPHGLAESHFEWPVRGTRLLRKNLRWLIPLWLPLIFVGATLRNQENERWIDSLGRIVLLLSMLLLTYFLRCILRPTTGILQEVIAYNRGGWIDRLKYIWYPAAVLVPLVMAGLALVGYLYTAQELIIRLNLSTLVLVVLGLITALAMRWVLVSRRKLALEQLRQRQAAALAESEEGEPLPAEQAETAAITVEEPGLDLTTINQQTRQLIHSFVGIAGIILLWGIWAEVLPAFLLLDRIPLWPGDEPVAAAAPAVPALTGGEGAEQAATQETTAAAPLATPDVVTLADLILSILIFAMTVIAAKNVPGLMEMVLLQRLPLEPSIRYATTTITRYAIVVVGVILGAAMIGVGWNKVQWLVAAFSVGLGIGLQEIFGNFVSGLIILFERPVRVGDVVTIGDVTGTVSRINIRATTIMNWDRQELLVPNKEFITGRLLNWSLTDKINRVVFPVGVAYGSDTEKTRELLFKVCREHPRVLDEPHTLVNFEEFGDSALIFIVRAYVPSIDYRLKVINDLHMAIDKEFREAGIEIAFPQRDIHVRSIEQEVPIHTRDGGNGNVPAPARTEEEV